MDPNIRVRRLADIKKQLGLEEDRGKAHRVVVFVFATLSLPSESVVISCIRNDKFVILLGKTSRTVLAYCRRVLLVRVG